MVGGNVQKTGGERCMYKWLADGRRAVRCGACAVVVVVVEKRESRCSKILSREKNKKKNRLQ